ncbi:MAG: DUF1549 and DUF1553 domain-containing protein [Pirellulales bacterium]|nr:DUF1549 and DUF1553 domain-containing protein [Pirellulales bacterium]
MVRSLLFRACAMLLICAGRCIARAEDGAERDLGGGLPADVQAHWAYRPLAEVRPPQVGRSEWVRTTVDRFILAAIEARATEGVALVPLPEAARTALLRRVTFDLTGLPPTPEELAAFLEDRAADAYEKVVDRLLASHAHAERYAQHWLDLARYADTDGFEHDQIRPEAWRYRDWVIDAIARDMPLDEFIRRQVAGDELYPDDPEAAVATGFLLCGPDMPDLNSQEERRHNVLNEMTATVGSVFLGLQVGCAQCHDHKWDPIRQTEFYRLRACFEGLALFARHPLGRVVQQRGGVAGASHVYVRGDFRRAGPEVGPGFPRVANPWGEEVEAAPSGASFGRRAALARWLTRPDHPLVTRVLANRLWQWHFGRGLCRTPSDVGTAGDVPVHAELLDWLAAELVRGGWSARRMHRLLVTSAVYRTASRPAGWGGADRDAERAMTAWRNLLAADPENVLWARFPIRRLAAEEVRDSLLAVGGLLQGRRGGPGVMPPLPAELEATLLRGQWQTSPNPLDHYRRSVYLFVRRNLRDPLLEAFDRPDTLASCPLRGRSTTAPQALALLHAPLAWQAAEGLARLARVEAGDDAAAVVRYCMRRAWGRDPSERELALATRFLSDGGPLRIGSQDRLVDLCRALLNANEFVYID